MVIKHSQPFRGNMTFFNFEASKFVQSVQKIEHNEKYRQKNSKKFIIVLSSPEILIELMITLKEILWSDIRDSWNDFTLRKDFFYF